MDPATLWVKLRVAQSRSAGLAARITLRSRPGETLTGRVTHDEKIIPTFKRVYHVRDGQTVE